jgi:hypothetical protein
VALAWLAIAIVAGIAAAAIGWPAWQSYRGREARDLNTERYLAWRGRAARAPGPSRGSVREGMTGEERRRIYVGAGLAIAAVVSLFVFLATS